jgi:hypothetical protein
MAMTMVACACALGLDTARAQTFHIDLDELTRIYDELDPRRTATAVWDTTRAFDWDHVALGPFHYRIPNFLTTEYQRTQDIVDYRSFTTYRVVFTLPRTYSLRHPQRDEGDFLILEPRDLDVPGLRMTFTSIDSLAAEIRRRSLEDAWVEVVTAAIAGQQLVLGERRGGITIQIPVPMPRQLESIFGPSEKTHINITGRESITISGKTTKVDPFIGVEGRQSQSLFPSLDMKQELDVSLSGTIGDKVIVQIDHSSQAIGDDANKIRVNYQGYDDVIKLVELGNTSLSLPGSGLVSVSAASKGLFGVKVLAQLGSTDITFIASKQEGETSTASFTPAGGSIGQTEQRILRDVDYVKGKYFYFDHPLVFVGPDEAEAIDVYLTVTPRDLQINPAQERFPGRAFVDQTGFGLDIDDAMAAIAANIAADSVVVVPPPSIQNDFRLLTFGIDYSYVTDIDAQFVGIELTQTLTDVDKTLAVRYTNDQGSRVGGDYSDYGITPGFLESDTLALEILRPRNPVPDDEFGWTWGYMMRHVYNLGLSNIDPGTFVLEIEDLLNPRLDHTIPEGAIDPYIRIFGLDQYDRSGNPVPDGLVDLTAGVVDLTNGLLAFPAGILIMPDLATAQLQAAAIGDSVPETGFAPDRDFVVEWADSFSFYDTEYTQQWDVSRRIYTEKLNLNQELEVNQYRIVVSAVSTSKTFRIDAFNIVENSESITLDGRRLARGTDYSIDYLTGEITLQGTALEQLGPDSKIAVDYEFKPLGGSASSNLIGVHALGKAASARIGTTWLYESKSVTDRNPRIGEEPTRVLVGDVNGSIQRQSQRLTDFVNMLPLVDTDAPSTINATGAVALSIPDPNTRGEAYVDDFEGVEDSDRISMSRRTWLDASVPLVYTGAIPDPMDPLERLGIDWYNIEPELATTKRDLNPELDDRENSLITALDIDLEALPAVGDTTSWVGIMTGFGGGGLDLTEGQFIEIWVNDFKQNPLDRGGLLRIDMGRIDENFFEPDKGDFQDEDNDRDGFAAAFDDTGLDGLFNEDEPGNTGNDPDLDLTGDDHDLTRINGRFSKANGTEANRAYDTEDLDNNGQFDRTNAFFTYTIDLASEPFIDIAQRYPSYDGFNDQFHRYDAWRLYRVRLSDAQIVSATGVQPRVDQITHMRIWFKDVRSVAPTDSAVVATVGRRIQIAEFKIQGNRWLLDGVRDLAGKELDPDSLVTPTEFTIGVISNKSDPGLYVPPVVPREENGVFDKESSLVLAYDSLAAGLGVRVRKQFAGNGIDLSQYRDLNLWVNSDSARAGFEYFFRMGTNENNYYELAVPLDPGHFPSPSSWAQVLVKMADLTNLKFEPRDSLGVAHGVAVDRVEPNLTYPMAMRGNPSLFGVRFLYAGVRNAGGGAARSGRVWINDIFVGDVRRDVDTALRFDASLNLGGGIISLGGSYSRRGPDFQGLRQRRGGGALNESYAVNAKTSLQHFLPLFGFDIPLTGSYGRTKSLPKFTPNSDTEIQTEAVRDSLRTESVAESFTTSLQKRGSKNVLLRYTIDKMTNNFSVNRTARLSPQSADTSVGMGGTLGYQINWAPGKKRIRLWGDTHLRYWPNSLNIRTVASRRTTQRWRNLGGVFKKDPYQYTARLQNTGSVAYSPLKTLSSTFNMTVNRDVALPHYWMGVNVGTETSRAHNTRVGWRPTFWILSAFTPDLEVTTRYGEDSSPNARRPEDPVGTRSVTASRDGSLRLRFDIGRYMRKLFGKLGWKVGESASGGARRPSTGGTGSSPGGAPPATAENDTTPKQRPGAGTALRQLGRILTDLRVINVSLGQRTSNTYSRIPERPSVAYQVGLTSATGIETEAGPIDTPERLNESMNMSLESGVAITSNFDVRAIYSMSNSKTDFRASKTVTTNQTWPDVQVKWAGLERFGLFRSYLANVDANLNFKRTSQESGREGEEPDNTRTTLQLSPALVFGWKNGINSNLSVSYNKNTSDTRGSVSETTSLGVALDFRKQFAGGSGFRIPIPFITKRVQWKSQLDANLTIAYNRAGGKRYTEGSDFFEPIPRTTSFRVSPAASYNFTQALSGRMFVNVARSYREATDQTTTSVELGVSAIFTF